MSLQLSSKFALPKDAVLWSFAIVAIRGAGKSYDAAKMAEEMLKLGIPIVVFDPMGIWWGLRVGVSPASDHVAVENPGMPVLIFGGRHQDLPIPTTTSKTKHEIIDEPRLRQTVNAILKAGLSVVLDTSELSITQQTRAVGIFGDELFRKNADYGTRHVFIEEADVYCPQKPRGETEMSHTAIDNLVRRGGNYNLGVTMITQRAAVLDKDVLSQANCLIAMRLMWQPDKKTVQSWVQSQVKNEREVKKLAKWYDSLKDLKNGEAWIYSPEHDIFERVQFGERETLHASREFFLKETWEQKNITLRDVREFVAKFIQTGDKTPRPSVSSGNIKQPKHTIVQPKAAQPRHEPELMLRPGPGARTPEDETFHQQVIAQTTQFSIEHSDVQVKIVHTDPVLRTLSTKTGLGQIVYVCVNDLEGKPATSQDIIAAMKEYGWQISPNTMSPNLGRLVKEGYLVNESGKFRPPGKVKIEVVTD